MWAKEKAKVGEPEFQMHKFNFEKDFLIIKKWGQRDS